MNDDELIGRMQDAFDEPVPPAPADRIAQIRAAAQARAAQTATPAATAINARTRRTVLIGAAAAAAGAVGGAVLGRQTATDTVTGPPTEPISFAAGPGAVAGGSFAGELINHTWGVELLLDTEGLPVGAAYRVVYRSTADSDVDAGGFIGAELPIHCRCNAALLRADLRTIEIRDADERVVTSATVA